MLSLYLLEIESITREKMMVQDQKEPFMGREGLFRKKLNQLRTAGAVPQNTRIDTKQRLRELEQGGFLDTVKSTLEDADPKEMERITLLDKVTELYNHNTITRILTDEFKRSKRYKHDCTVLMILVDGLYGIQQNAGSEASDSILKGLADFLMNEVRDVDIPARYSAEQLLVVCPETNAEGVAVLAERIRTKVPTLRVSDVGQNWHVTVSMGIASFPAHSDSLEELLSETERALNLAVERGGNSFCIA